MLAASTSNSNKVEDNNKYLVNVSIVHICWYRMWKKKQNGGVIRMESEVKESMGRNRDSGGKVSPLGFRYLFLTFQIEFCDKISS